MPNETIPTTVDIAATEPKRTTRHTEARCPSERLRIIDSSIHGGAVRGLDATSGSPITLNADSVIPSATTPFSRALPGADPQSYAAVVLPDCWKGSGTQRSGPRRI